MTNNALKPADLERLKNKLNDLHRHLSSGLRHHERELSQEVPQDAKDALPLKEEFEILESEDRREENEILRVEEAMQRIADGTYGICTDCKKSIPVERLLVIPHAQYCVPCESLREKNLGTR